MTILDKSKVEDQTITLVAVVKGKHQILEHIIEKLGKVFLLSDITYSSRDDLSLVKCKTRNGTYNHIIDIQELTDIITTDLHIGRADIRDRRHKLRKVVFARDILAFMLRSKHKLSYPEIASLLGLKHHSTVLWACRKFDVTQKSKLWDTSLKQAYLICKANYERNIK